eukprot:g7856.t1
MEEEEEGVEAASMEPEEEEAASTEEEEGGGVAMEEEEEEEEAASTAATPEMPQSAGVPPASALRGIQAFINTVKALEERYVASQLCPRRLGKRKEATPQPPPAKERVGRRSARASVRTLRTLRTLGL